MPSAAGRKNCFMFMHCFQTLHTYTDVNVSGDVNIVNITAVVFNSHK